MKTPRITGSKIISTLKRAGFELVRIKGSHHYLKHPDTRSTVVPVHSGETVGVGLMNKILNDCDMNVEDSIKFF